MVESLFNLMRMEWLITALIFILLFLKLGKTVPVNRAIAIVVGGLLFAIFLATRGEMNGTLFAGMFQTRALMFIEKTILIIAVLLITLLYYDWLKAHAHGVEFLILLLTSLLGMFFMISAGNLLMFYLSLELATIPIAALSNFDLEKRKSSEAAMKMILSSAFASGFILFGISLIYGATGTIQFEFLQFQLNVKEPLQVLAYILFFSGFAFKLSVVPFHFWTADVYEGSPTAVAAFLSVVSKGAVTFIFITILYKVFAPLAIISDGLIAGLSILTILIGNFFALRQTQLKRFLAFSSIAQVGFILVALRADMATGTAAIIYFLIVYVFSNLAAFGVVGVLGNKAGIENLEGLRGLYKNNKLLSWSLAIALFSLAGIPPTAGFWGKMFLIMSGASQSTLGFILVVVLNLVVSLFYYLRIVKLIFSESNVSTPENIFFSKATRWGFYICIAGILLTGFYGWLYEHILALS